MTRISNPTRHLNNRSVNNLLGFIFPLENTSFAEEMQPFDFYVYCAFFSTESWWVKLSSGEMIRFLIGAFTSDLAKFWKEENRGMIFCNFCTFLNIVLNITFYNNHVLRSIFQEKGKDRRKLCHMLKVTPKRRYKSCIKLVSAPLAEHFNTTRWKFPIQAQKRRSFYCPGIKIPAEAISNPPSNFDGEF